MRDLVFLMYLSRGLTAYAYTTSYGASTAICIRKKKRIFLFVFEPPCRRVLKQKYLSLWEKNDKNILIFVKILLDVFQGITEIWQAPPPSSPACPTYFHFWLKYLKVWAFFDRQCQPKPGLFSLIFPHNF